LAVGYCGGLRGGIKVSDVINPIAVYDEAGGCLQVSKIDLPDVQHLKMISTDRIISSAKEKKKLSRDFQVDTVDMEAYTIAKMAAARSIPVVILKSVLDDSQTDIPFSESPKELISKPDLHRKFMEDMRRAEKALESLLPLAIEKSYQIGVSS
jgi:nucleoside phosphorylase